jgi:hypothetical protein
MERLSLNTRKPCQTSEHSIDSVRGAQDAVLAGQVIDADAVKLCGAPETLYITKVASRWGSSLRISRYFQAKALSD